jgi:hypothetical protein
VTYTIAKYQRKNGHESKVIRIKGPDKYHIDEFYKNYGLFVTPDELVCKSVAEAQKADVIHIHSVAKMAINIRKIYGKSKIIILHYHGTDIRGFGKEKMNDCYLQSNLTPKKFLRKMLLKRMHIKAQRSADRVIVATPDLINLVKGSVLLHNPVDKEHFNQKSNRSSISGRAVLINTEVTDVEMAIDYYRRKGLDLNIQIYDRTKNPISYKDFPKFLKSYDIYVDLRFVNNRLLRNLSTTALQALACGLRVLNYNLEYIDKLPAEHDPMNVTSRLSSIYSQKRNRLEVAILVLEQFPLDIVYVLYSLLKKMSFKKT